MIAQIVVCVKYIITKTWNAAFGIVGTSYIAQPPEVCPYCGSTNLTKIADGWSDRNLEVWDKQQ